MAKNSWKVKVTEESGKVWYLYPDLNLTKKDAEGIVTQHTLGARMQGRKTQYQAELQGTAAGRLTHFQIHGGQ